MEEDPRGHRTVQVVETSDHLAAVLARLSETTGVKLEAAEPMADTVLVCRYLGTLTGLMDALTDFFAADREHKPRWVRSGGPDHARYRLDRDIATAQAIERLRRNRESELVQRMEGLLRIPAMTDEQWKALQQQDPRLAEALKSARQWAMGEGGLRHFGQLSPEQRRKVYAGGRVTIPLAAEAGKKPLAEHIRELVGADSSRWSGRGRITYSMPGPAPFQRSFCWLVDGDPERPGTGAAAGSSFTQIFPDLAPERQVRDWRDRYGDPAPRDARRIPFFTGGPSFGDALRRHVLIEIANRAYVNLIADDVGRSLDLQFFPATGSVAELLDQACRLQPAMAVRNTENHGSFWRKVGDTYLVRSLSWPEEEVGLIPYRWVEAWRASERTHGRLTLDDVFTMAALPPQQLVRLALWYPQAEQILQVQAPLRWYAGAAPAMKQRMAAPPGVPLALLGIDAGELLPDVDPMDPGPGYARMIRAAGPERVNFTLRERDQQVNGAWKPAVSVAFTEYDGTGRVRCSNTVRIPLTRDSPPPRPPGSVGSR
jgi:hypothetical protein